MLIYPLLAFSNFNILFFVGICLIFLPQIYLNGVNGIRPELSSPYYTKFLMARFIIIVILQLFSSTWDLSPGIFFNFSPIIISAFSAFFSSFYSSLSSGTKKTMDQRKFYPPSSFPTYSTTNINLIYHINKFLFVNVDWMLNLSEPFGNVTGEWEWSRVSSWAQVDEDSLQP